MTHPSQNRKAVHRLAHWTGLSYAQCKTMLFHLYSDSSSSEWMVDRLFETAAKENPELFCQLFKQPTIPEPPKMPEPPEVITEGIHDKFQISPAMAEIMKASDILTWRGRIWVDLHTAKGDPEVLREGVTKETRYRVDDHTFEDHKDANLYVILKGRLEGREAVKRALHDWLDRELYSMEGE
nr:hypothetical protein [uncultured Cohaesibacter sp.]